MKSIKIIVWLGIFVVSSVFSLTWAPVASLPDNNSLIPGPVYDGYFYLGAVGESGGSLFRTSNGIDFSAVTGGFINMDNTGIYPLPFVVQNKLYLSTENNSGFEIWASSTGSDGSWINIATNGFGTGASMIDGSAVFNDDLYIGYNYYNSPNDYADLKSYDTIWDSRASFSNFYSMAPCGVFNDKLYVVLNKNGFPYLERYDGSSWEIITTNAFGTSGNDLLAAYQSFNGYLYCAVDNNSGAQLWRSATGNAGDWTQVLDFSTIDTNNEQIESFSMPGDGFLYFSTYNNATGTEIWRTAGGTSDFVQVNIDGFGITTNAGSHLSRELFNGTLIAGTESSAITGAKLYGTAITLPESVPSNIDITNAFTEEALQILGSDIPGYEGTFVPGEGNPLSLALDGITSGTVHFRIFTLTGETIFDGEVTCDANGHFSLNIPPDIAAGVYVIQVEGPNFHFTKKLAVLE